MTRGLNFRLNDLPEAMRRQAQAKLEAVGTVRTHVCEDEPDAELHPGHPRFQSKLVEYKGESLSVRDWASRCKLPVSTLRNRLNRGITFERAIVNDVSLGQKKSKFRNTWTVVDNIKFPSLKEANRYKELRLLQAAGEISDLQWHVPFSLNHRGIEICVYIADFVYRKTAPTKRPARVVEDVKGYKQGSVYRLFKVKKALMKALHSIDVIET